VSINAAGAGKKPTGVRKPRSTPSARGRDYGVLLDRANKESGRISEINEDDEMEDDPTSPEVEITAERPVKGKKSAGVLKREK
jgi:hypothetical protein